LIFILVNITFAETTLSNYTFGGELIHKYMFLSVFLYRLFIEK